MTEPDVNTSGVKVLIDRIRDEGVQSARDEADRIISDAKAQAARILSEAKAEAASVKKETQAAMEREQTATIEALRIAARDTGLGKGEERRPGRRGCPAAERVGQQPGPAA